MSDRNTDQGIHSDTVTFSFPIYLRYLLRGCVPAIVAALFLFSASHGWSSDNLSFGLFCAVVGVAWWWALKRYGLTVTLGDYGIRFNRETPHELMKWQELVAVRFSTSGVWITGSGRTRYVDSDLSGWDRFERVLRERAPAEALAAWLKPPFTVRTKWRGLLQPGIFSLASITGGTSQLASGQWKAGLVMLGLGGFFVFLLRGAVLWYRFGEDSLLIQRLAGREHHEWADLQFATIKDTVLAIDARESRGVITVSEIHVRSWSSARGCNTACFWIGVGEP